MRRVSTVLLSIFLSGCGISQNTAHNSNSLFDRMPSSISSTSYFPRRPLSTPVVNERLPTRSKYSIRTFDNGISPRRYFTTYESGKIRRN